MQINEIFYSIQGEGQWMGLPNIFIRTMGCNLRCSYCDTTYAYHEGKPLSITEIIDHISTYDCKKICITGGEPLLQKHLINLIHRLSDLHYEILIETNGSLPIDEYVSHKNIIMSMDVKCPSSTMQTYNHAENMNVLRSSDQIKYIIGDKDDYSYAKQHLHTYHPDCMVFFQPVWKFKPEILAEWILQDHLPVRLGTQLHKLLWGEKRRT